MKTFFLQNVRNEHQLSCLDVLSVYVERFKTHSDFLINLPDICLRICLYYVFQNVSECDNHSYLQLRAKLNWGMTQLNLIESKASTKNASVTV